MAWTDSDVLGPARIDPILSVDTISSTMIGIYSLRLSLLFGLRLRALNGTDSEDPISFLGQNKGPILRN